MKRFTARIKKLTAWLNMAAVLLCCIWMAAPAQKAYAFEADGAEAEKVLQEILAEHEVMALVYLADTQSLQQEPTYDSEVLAQLPSGQTVFIHDIVVDDDEMAWAYIETYFEGETQFGYIPRFYLACADEDFLQWEEEYLGGAASGISTYAGWDASIELFPESYKAALYALKERHPNWIFVMMNTGLRWDTVIENEMKEDRSLIHKSFPDYVRGECYDDGNWYYPTKEILEYYMDPRNGLKEEAIFQFELLTYNATYHTESAVNLFLNNTFMNSSQNAPGTDMTFAHIFWAVGAEQNVSPFHLASRVYQEQGSGNSGLISGNYAGYEGYYNYFNVRASGTSTKEIIENGLAYARTQGWNTAYTSILGGSKVISANYISKGQDTLYLQKYNVNTESASSLYNHQYMQNITAPTSEGASVKKMYQGAGSLENTFVFKIPVYTQMPASACPMPTGESTGSGNKNPEGTGWREENGGFYWYENNVLQGTEGRGREIYDPETDAWYWLDAAEGGRRAVDKDVYQESDGGKWVRYDENGRMVKGEDNRYGGWYRFDEGTGAMVKGWYIDGNGKIYYYDIDSGQMVHGYVTIDGQTRYFDYVTGVLADKTWVWIDGVEYWFEDGVKQGLEGRGKEIYDPGTDAWYWLDAVDGGRKAVSKDVYQEADGGKWVRYDADGQMIKGWQTTGSGTYYFDPVTGAMAKGSVVINGVGYYFDTVTGVQR